MAHKLMYIPNYDTQLVVETFGHSTKWPNQHGPQSCSSNEWENDIIQLYHNFLFLIHFVSFVLCKIFFILFTLSLFESV